MNALAHPRWRLPILLLVAIAARALTLGDPIVHVDEEFYYFAGDALWHGRLPFVDVWDRKPAGLFLLYALPGGLGFPAGIWGYQLLALASVVATAWAIARMAERVGFATGATAAAVAYILWLDLLGGQGGQSPVFYNLLTIMAALLILPHDGAAPRHAAGLGAMALIGVALQIKYSVLFEGMFFGLWLLGDAWHHDRRALPVLGYAGALIVAALLPTALIAAYYVAIGAWDAFFYANFLSIFHRNPDPPGELLGNFGQIVLITAPIVALAILALRRSPPGRGLRFLAWWLGVAIVSVLIFRPWFDHYSLPLLLPACAAAAGMLGSDWWQGRRLAALLAAAALAGQIVLVATIAGRGSRAQFAALTRAVGVGPGCLYVYSGSTMLYVSSRRCTLSRYAMPSHLTREREARAIGVDPDVEIRRILAARPAVVVMRPPYIGERPAAHALVLDAMARRYRLAAQLPMGNEAISVYRLRP